jgi:hypothetical protein
VHIMTGLLEKSHKFTELNGISGYESKGTSERSARHKRMIAHKELPPPRTLEQISA